MTPTTHRQPSAPSGPPDLVVSGCTALRHDPDGAVFFTADTTIAVHGGTITSVTAPGDGPAADPARPATGRAATGRTAAEWTATGRTAAEHIDARGLVAVPGLVNCHTHAPMVLLRGYAEDVPLQEWFDDRVLPVEARLTDHDIALGARLACAEMIRGGVTCFADHYFGMAAIAGVVAETGLRAFLGQTYLSAQGPAARTASLEFALAAAGAADGRITTALAPHAPYTVTAEDLAATARLARDHGLPVHLHAAENLRQTEESLARHGLTPIEVLDRAGLLDVDLLIAHGTGIVDRDHAVLRRATGRIAVASTPRGYLKFGWDPSVTPVRALTELGIPVGLGTDGAASGNSLDLWDTLGLTALTQKQAERDPRWMTARQALRHATLLSAGAVGLGDRIGSLAPGRCADIVLLDLGGPHTQPVHDLAATLVHSARASDVVTTVVDGRVLMRDRELLTVDLPAVLAEIGQRLPELVRGRDPQTGS